MRSLKHIKLFENYNFDEYSTKGMDIDWAPKDETGENISIEEEEFVLVDENIEGENVYLTYRNHWSTRNQEIPYSEWMNMSREEKQANLQQQGNWSDPKEALLKAPIISYHHRTEDVDFDLEKAIVISVKQV